MKRHDSRFFRSAAAVCILLLTSAAAFADDPPAWLRQAASVTPPSYEKDVPAVVLYNEEQVTLGGDGKLATTDNYAVKILTRDGRGYAMARADYLVSSGKVKDIMAWLIRPDGTTKYYDKKTVVDIIADTDDVYNEGRLKIINASDDVSVGYVFGYTTVVEDSPLFYQDQWSFQGRLPTLVSRYLLNLPSGWSATSITFNSPEIRPQISGSTYTWEVRDLAPIAHEPMGPAPINLAPRIAVNYAPAGAANGINRVFANWSEVSRWASALHDPQVILDDAVAAKARDLTVNSQTELEKIRAIGTYVQNLQYISIDIGVGYGNGYRPRPSTTVLGRGYGDCKDKANLMRALLRAVKIEAYPVAIFSGDPTFVREQWASPRQFNHCIIAVKVSDSTVAPIVIQHEKLGRLLIFDPTDPFTPVGDLPGYLQGSLALIAAGDVGGLSRMPVTAGTDFLERIIDATINDTGEIKGKIAEHAQGQTSTAFRRELRDLSATDYRKALEGWLTRGATGAQLVNVRSKDDFLESGFDLDVDFTAPRYAQLMQDKLLVFKPAIVGRRQDIYLTDAKRTTPIDLDGFALREISTFSIPSGFVVDETPDPVTLDTDFGKYSTRYEMKGGKLLFTRTMSMKRMQVPVERYAALKAFFLKVRDADQSPVVLARK